MKLRPNSFLLLRPIYIRTEEEEEEALSVCPTVTVPAENREAAAMADVVQYRLERMVDELDDLERRGIFTRAEIAEIVKQRRKFEYRLKRPSPLKEDFIAYIDYEVKLDELRQLRRKAVAYESKKRKKKSVSDYAGVARIVEIYRLATMRYKGDINLWFRYLEFCKQKRHGRMKKVKSFEI